MYNRVKKYFDLFFIFEKIRWNIEKKYFKSCGTKTYMAKNFNILNHKYISIGDNTCFAENCSIEGYDSFHGASTKLMPTIIIGSNVFINSYCTISCIDKIIIGDGCLFGSNVMVVDNSHGKNSVEEMKIPPNDRKLYSKGPVIIGKNVWIGKNVCIMPNVTIGDYSIIGANSVVTHNIPPYTIAVGCPAKVIKNIK